MRNAIVTMALAGALLLGAVAPTSAQITDPLAVLRSDASYQDKDEACRMLSIKGGPEAVPVLEPLLLDDQMSHLARYALEPMPYPEAGAALRNALPRAAGAVKVGLINSLAIRGDAEAVPAVIAALADSDPLVAREAARALGVLATPQAAQALSAALPGAPAENRNAVCDGIIGCAEAFAAQGRRAEALALYDLLRATPDLTLEARTGAFLGAVLTRGPGEGLPLLAEAARGEDPVLFAAALRAARELEANDAVSAALAEALPALAHDRQIALMQTLGHRGGSVAGPAVAALLDAESEEVRIAAVNTLARIAYAPALGRIVQLACGEPGDLTRAARNAWAYFPSPEGDATLRAVLETGAAPERRVAVELIGQGGVPEPAGLLIAAAADDADGEVRAAALKALQTRAGMAEMPRLLDILCATSEEAELNGAEGALRAVVDRAMRVGRAEVVIHKAVYGALPAGPSADVTAKVSEMVKSGAVAVPASNANFGDPAPGLVKSLSVEYTANGAPFSKTVREGETLLLATGAAPPAVVDAFHAAYDRVKAGGSPAAQALLRLLGVTGSPAALDTVLAAANGEHAELRRAAERVLCDWPTPDAVPAAMAMAQNAPDATLRVLALRGAVRMLKESDAPARERLDRLAALMATATSPDDKKQVLSGLGTVPHVDAIGMIFAHFADEAVHAEAVQAAIAVAERLGADAREDTAVFNGRDLTGWSATTGYWSVEDGAITGRSAENVPETAYIWSDVEVGDFYLAADVKLEPPTANSGIQFRSKIINDAGHALGYQGDIGKDVWGRLYHQGGRGMLDWNGRAEEAVVPGEWNRFEILAVGPAIWTAINGKLGVACLDLGADDERVGRIAFQIHAGPPQTHQVRIEKLVHNPKVEIAGMKGDQLIPELVIPAKP